MYLYSWRHHIPHVVLIPDLAQQIDHRFSCRPRLGFQLVLPRF